MSDTKRLVTLQDVRGFVVQEAGRVGSYLAEDRGLVLARLSEVETALASLWAAGRRADRARLASEPLPPKDQQTDDHALRLRLAQEYGGVPSKEHIAAFVRAGQDERRVQELRTGGSLPSGSSGDGRARDALDEALRTGGAFCSEPSAAEVAGVAADLKRFVPRPPPHCCALGCDVMPKWSVHTGKGLVEDYTHACDTHLAGLCDMHQPSTVVRMPSMADRARASEQMNTGDAVKSATCPGCEWCEKTRKAR
jgi:hypothetical protein